MRGFLGRVPQDEKQFPHARASFCRKDQVLPLSQPVRSGVASREPALDVPQRNVEQIRLPFDLVRNQPIHFQPAAGFGYGLHVAQQDDRSYAARRGGAPDAVRRLTRDRCLTNRET